MIGDDIALAQALFAGGRQVSGARAVTQHLSITTFRYVPTHLPATRPRSKEYLSALNQELLDRLQKGGEAFISNAVLDGRYLLRACIVNFRTTLADVEALPEIVVRLGRRLDAELRPEALQAAVVKG